MEDGDGQATLVPFELSPRATWRESWTTDGLTEGRKGGRKRGRKEALLSHVVTGHCTARAFWRNRHHRMG